MIARNGEHAVYMLPDVAAQVQDIRGLVVSAHSVFFSVSVRSSFGGVAVAWFGEVKACVHVHCSHATRSTVEP